jgi:hypothetical protein
LFAVRYTFLSAFVSDGIEMPHKCVKSADNFCYTCGEITLVSRKCVLTPVIRRAYFLYSGCKVGGQDNSWAPDVCFTSCSSKLRVWVKHEKMVQFAVPMIWRELINLLTNCYFCMVPPIQKEITNKKNGN